MAKASIPEYKKTQQQYRSAKRAQTKAFAHGGTVDLGIKKFKREHPEMGYDLIATYKENGWNTFDPKRLELKPKPVKFEAPKPRQIITPFGLTNHGRHHFRHIVRKSLKEQRDAAAANKI